MLAEYSRHARCLSSVSFIDCSYWYPSVRTNARIILSVKRGPRLAALLAAHQYLPTYSLRPPGAPGFETCTGTHGNACNAHMARALLDSHSFIHSFIYCPQVTDSPVTNWQHPRSPRVSIPPHVASTCSCQIGDIVKGSRPAVAFRPFASSCQKKGCNPPCSLTQSFQLASLTFIQFASFPLFVTTVVACL